MTAVRYALLPLIVLVVLITFAAVLSYGLLWLSGDVLPVSKLISKLTLILLILCVFPLKAKLKLSWQDLGFAPWQRFFWQLQQGLVLGILSLLPVMVVLYWLDVQVWDQTRVWTWSKVLEKVGLGLFFALLIGTGEELLFRGLLLSILRRRMALMVAMLLSSFYYAALHFLKATTQLTYQNLTLGAVLGLIPEAFGNWLNPNILSALAALFVVGLFLAVIRSRVRHSLGLCIGCHAGWVWQIKVCKDLFNLNHQSAYLYLVSSYDGVVGPLVSLWLLIALLMLIVVARR